MAMPANSFVIETSLQQDTEIIQNLDLIFNEAIDKGASDIHFESFVDGLHLRYRIDGLLYLIKILERRFVPQINSRLKIMANLDIAEKRLPQDGRFSFKALDDKKYDCRISTCPTMFGEKIVVRVLNPSNVILNIGQLGLELSQKQILEKQLQKPQGMLLVTGPTGSGKTLTLYSILSALNTSVKNIATIEDPIEINLPGVNQTEVNNKIGLNFATALRTFLRQDPDIIMVGEIRDRETAEIAIKAAQTGHFVLATLHTNSATEAINRLQNMQIEAFNLASAINLVIAQRLVRKICSYCKQRVACDKCNAGYSGRVGVFEVLSISKEISTMIANKRSTEEIAFTARRDGFVNLREIGMQKVASGVTTFDEINRVIS